MNGNDAGTRRCRWCGTALERNAKNGRMPLDCPACAMVRKKVYHRLRFKFGRDVTHAMLAEEMAVLAAERAAMKFRPSASRARCLFCGRERAVDARGYCRECVREHLDVVHTLTGRSNGWDRPPRKAAVAADGWRGRAVAGPPQLWTNCAGVLPRRAGREF